MANEEVLDDNLNKENRPEEPKFPWFGLIMLAIGFIKLMGGRGIFGYISICCGIGLFGLYLYEKNKYDNY